MTVIAEEECALSWGTLLFRGHICVFDGVNNVTGGSACSVRNLYFLIFHISQTNAISTHCSMSYRGTSFETRKTQTKMIFFCEVFCKDIFIRCVLPDEANITHSFSFRSRVYRQLMYRV